MSSKIKVSKKNILKTFFSALWWCAVVLLALILINIFGAKLTGKVPKVFGYSIINIVSGSMEDEIPEGSYILIKRIDTQKTNQDDIICFYSRNPQIYGMPNTHRVAEDPIRNGEKIEFVTKGDANPTNDKETARGEDVIGIYVKRLDKLTAISDALSGKTMIIIFAAMQLCFIGVAICSIIAMVKRKDPHEDNNDTSIDKK
jgi:signal peptidase